MVESQQIYEALVMALATGAASEGGKEAYKKIKEWLIGKFGTDKEVTQQLIILEANPNNKVAQDNFRASLQQHATQFNDPIFLKLIEALQANNDSKIQITGEHAKVTVINGDMHIAGDFNM